MSIAAKVIGLLKGVFGISQTSPGIAVSGAITASGGITVSSGQSASFGGVVTATPAIRTTGSLSYFTITSPADTTLTASTECIGENHNLSATRQFATGAIATQREFVIQAPTYSFVGASTITTAATLAITGAPIAGTNATITTPYALDVQSGNSFFGGAIITNNKITNYNNIATAGWGVPAIYGSGRLTAQVAAVASVAAYTVGAADGSFDVSANVNVTAATTASFTVTVTYTDETNTSRTATFSFVQAGTPIPIQTITNVTGTGAYSALTMQLRCKASTAITIATVGTFTSVTYNVEGSIVQLS